MFSSTIKLGELNDYIAPSQACINPEFLSAEGKVEIKTDKSSQIENGISLSYQSETIEPNIIKQDKVNKTATISLADCLACSGCITSAETFLVEQQSLSALKKQLKENMDLVYGITISSQSVTSLAYKLGLCFDKCLRVIEIFLKSKGFKKILCSVEAESVCCELVFLEFKKRLRFQSKPKWLSPSTSTAVDKQTSQDQVKEGDMIPLIVSSCPGWVCYVEKQYPEVIPYLSNVVSPQQLDAIKLKERSSCEIFLASVQPCPDKKLEASRKDFFDVIRNSQDVNLVLTTNELFAWLEEEDYTSLIESLEDSDKSTPRNYYEHGSSCGYLEYVYRKFADEKFGFKVVDNIPYKVKKNRDFKEFTLEDPETKQKINFAIVYGFRNIQKIIKQLRNGNCKYHFIEVMACPKGCLNGGGQIKIDKDDFHHLENINLKRPIRTLEDKSDTLENIPAKEFTTRFHAIPKLENGLLEKW